MDKWDHIGSGTEDKGADEGTGEAKRTYKFRGVHTTTPFSERTGRKMTPSSSSRNITVEASSREEAMRLIREEITKAEEGGRRRREEYSGKKEKAPLVDIKGKIREIGHKAGRPAGSPVEQLDVFDFGDEKVAREEKDW